MEGNVVFFSLNSKAVDNLIGSLVLQSRKCPDVLSYVFEKEWLH